MGRLPTETSAADSGAGIGQQRDLQHVGTLLNRGAESLGRHKPEPAPEILPPLDAFAGASDRHDLPGDFHRPHLLNFPVAKIADQQRVWQFQRVIAHSTRELWNSAEQLCSSQTTPNRRRFTGRTHFQRQPRRLASFESMKGERVEGIEPSTRSLLPPDSLRFGTELEQVFAGCFQRRNSRRSGRMLWPSSGGCSANHAFASASSLGSW